MKKRIAILLLVCLVVASCFMLTACSNPAGVYKFHSLKVEQGGMIIEAKVGEKFMNAITLTEDYATLELKSDGTAALSTSATGTLITEEGTWEICEGGVAITFDEETVECKIEKGIITIEQDGTTLSFEKK